jgi:hypothetical protein
MTPRGLALRSLLALATVTAIWLLLQPGPHDERPADEPRKPIDRPRPSPAASKPPPPPTVFAAWTDGERSFVLLNRPADVVARTWDTEAERAIDVSDSLLYASSSEPRR